MKPPTSVPNSSEGGNGFNSEAGVVAEVHHDFQRQRASRLTLITCDTLDLELIRAFGLTLPLLLLDRAAFQDASNAVSNGVVVLG